jgi:hypothetical protein
MTIACTCILDLVKPAIAGSLPPLSVGRQFH